jgi:hypothetical protein
MQMLIDLRGAISMYKRTKLLVLLVSAVVFFSLCGRGYCGELYVPSDD